MQIQEQKQIQIEDYIEIILRRKWFIIILFIVSIIGILLTLLLLPPMYRSTTLILVEPQKVPEAYVKATVTVDIADRLNTITQQVMSRTRLESIINELGLYREERERFDSEGLVELMRKHIKIDVIGKDSFTISYIGYNPETVMHVTNRLTSLFIEENLKVREQQAEGTTEFLDTQLQNLKATLEEQETKIKAFKERYMGELPTQLEANLRTLDRLQLNLQTTNDAIKAAEDRKIVLEKQLTEINPNLGGTEARLAALRAELSKLSSIYTDKYPDIIRLKNEIAEIENEMKAEKSSESSFISPMRSPWKSGNPLYATLSNQLMDVNMDINNLREKQKEITKNIAVFQSRVERIPAREQQMIGLLRDYENTKSNYQNLLGKKLDAQLAENLEKRQQGEQFRILDPANLPLRPFKPNPRRITLMGVLLGLGSGLGLAFLLEYIDGSFRKAEDVYATIGLPVLASVPKVRIGIR